MTRKSGPSFGPWNGLWLLAAVLWTGILAWGAGSLPALGPFLDVQSGIWAYEEQRLEDAELPGLHRPVSVAIDAAGVPHFFAESEEDLYRAQGYVMASQRLFQMDLATRVTAGRLGEWVGDRARERDEFFVRFGLRESARIAEKSFTQDARARRMLEAFVDGVNIYIRTLKDVPPEYKLLGTRPEPFTVLKVMHMGRALTFSLAGRSYDTFLTRIQQTLGTESVLDLFPEFLPSTYEDIVVPTLKVQSRGPRPQERAEQFTFRTALKDIPFFPLPAAGNGSNNWAVGPHKSTTGNSLLANDTHLGLSLPNIWYETQLSCPEFNAYGVSLAAVPGLVNGFNKDVAWGPTNGTTDVLDYYEVEFETATSNRYLHRGGWVEARVQTEEIEDRGGAVRRIDVVWTKLGVLLHREGRLGLVADWAGHRPGQELKAFRDLLSSRTVTECLRAFRPWRVPVQNFICADRDHVALQHTGFLPKRDVGSGRFVMDGRVATSGLEKGLSDDELPRSLDPAAGFVLSANQRAVDERFPHYLGWDWEEPFRAMSIRRRLRGKDKFSPEDMIRIQNDASDLQAELILPHLLKNIQEERLTLPQKSWVERLSAWDFVDRASSVEPSLFKAWFRQLKEELFNDDYQVQAKHFYPKDLRVLWLLERVERDPKDSDAAWVDNRKTESVESAPDLITRAFQRAWERLEAKHGSNPEEWTWAVYNSTQLPHIARLPGFGSQVLSMDGSGESIRGQKGQHGAVYKIVVALGEWPRAWIQVPGGNEGDPFSPRFGQDVEAWSRGDMRPAEFYKNLSEARAKAVRVVEFQPHSVAGKR